MNENIFKRTIQIEDIISPIVTQKTKKVTVEVWYPGCDFNKEACKIKDFLITEPLSYE